MGLIKDEYDGSRKYELEEIKDESIVKLTKENVYKVEAMIRTDSNYRNSSNQNGKPDNEYIEFFKDDNRFNKEEAPKGKYCGSSAYWINQLMQIIKDNKGISSDSYSYGQTIRGIVFSIDRENSTHLNQDTIGRNVVSNRIAKIPLMKLKDYLKNPTATDYELIDIISRTGKYEKEKQKAEHYHFSFATKFCHYLCLALYKETMYEDNFSIYDNVLSSALPKYIKYYLNESVNAKVYQKNYSKYIEYIDRLRECADINISRNGFDHLIWYYEKGRN